jgi:hypothetical protein
LRGVPMDRLQPTPVGSMPPLDLLTTPGSPEDDDPRGLAPAWMGDPSSVPLPEADSKDRLAGVGDDLDRTIFAALLAP